MIGAMMYGQIGMAGVWKSYVDTESDLIEFSRKNLASFKRPESIVFSSEPLPRNPLGKVLKRDLKQMYDQPIED